MTRSLKPVTGSSRDKSAENPCANAKPHEFSARYEQRKAALLEEYRTQQASADRRSRKRPVRWKVALIAAAALLVVLPAVSFAVANNAEFFANAFGTGTRVSTAAHDETYEDPWNTYTYTYPAREYVDVDLEEAERLLGGHTMSTPATMEMDGHTITVLSAVRDSWSAVVHFTIEREGGVTALSWDELTNEAKGAITHPDATFTLGYRAGTLQRGSAAFGVGMPNVGNGCTLVDEQRSTPEKLYCYDYVPFADTIADNASLVLEAIPRGADGTAESVQLADADALPSREFYAKRRKLAGTVEVSPLSLRFDSTAETIIGDSSSPGHINTMELTFTDGSTYTVADDSIPLDNSAYACGGTFYETWMFNRLIDPEAIKLITINGVRFYPIMPSAGI